MPDKNIKMYLFKAFLGHLCGIFMFSGDGLFY